MGDHVYPALEKAQGAVGPAMETANELKRHSFKFYKETDLSQFSSKLGLLSSKLGGLIDPIFVATSKLSPKFAKLLPSDTWDRVLFLVIAVITFYYYLINTYFVVKKA